MSSAPIRTSAQVTVSAPNCSANRRLYTARFRSAAGNRNIFGVSTYTANHSALVSAAIFCAALITSAQEGLGPTHTRSPS